MDGRGTPEGTSEHLAHICMPVVDRLVRCAAFHRPLSRIHNVTVRFEQS